MTEGAVLLEVRERVAVLTLSRPGTLNTLDRVMLSELKSRLRELAESPDLRAVIVTGAGGSFCAGVDVAGEAYDPVSAYPFLKLINRVFDDLEALPQPSVAAIRGPAVAAGLELALACTFRVAAEDARLGLPEIRLGLVPACGAVRRLPRLVGFGRALEMSLLGELVSGREAAETGLVTAACPPGKLDEVVWALAQKLASGPPLALRLTKDAFYAGAAPLSADQSLTEILAASTNHASKDKAEGLRAFFEKRPPEFHGL